jgi:hypothetical protein
MILETDALLARYSDTEQAAITDYLARTVDILQRSLGQGDAPR